MADDGNVDIRIRVRADTAPADKAKRAVESVGAAARTAAESSKGGFERFKGAVGRATSAVGALRGVLAGFGAAGLVAPLVGAFRNWRKSIAETEKKLQDARRAAAEAADAKAVREMAEAWGELKDAVNAANEARQRGRELLDEEVRLRREEEDARTDLDERRALAAIDPESPSAAAERAAVSARFAARRSETNASRRGEDVVLRRQALDEEARGAASAADALAGQLPAADRAILRARTRASTLDALSRERNDRDGTWYNPRKRTEEGDAERGRMRAEAERAREQVRALERDRDAKAREIAALRAKAEHANARRDLLGGALATAQTRREADALGAAQTVGEADRQLARGRAAEAARAEQARLERDRAAKAGKLAALQARADSQIAGADARVSREELEAEAARRNLAGFDATVGARRTGVASARAALAAQVEREEGDVRAAQEDARAIRSNLGALIQSLRNEIAAIERDLRAAKSRQNFSESEAQP
ncbi:MAG: hypothetical protein ACI4RA_05545 [Kiritimatiellia bacterium]